MTLAKTPLPLIGAAVLAILSPMGLARGASAPAAQAAVADQVNVSDKDLKAFVRAYVEYHKIRQNYEAKIASAKDEKQKGQLQREGNEKVKQALQKQGLTPESYNRLFVAVNNNQQLRQKALALISEERRKT